MERQEVRRHPYNLREIRRRPANPVVQRRNNGAVQRRPRPTARRLKKGMMLYYYNNVAKPLVDRNRVEMEGERKVLTPAARITIGGFEDMTLFYKGDATRLDTGDRGNHPWSFQFEGRRRVHCYAGFIYGGMADATLNQISLGSVSHKDREIEIFAKLLPEEDLGEDPVDGGGDHEVPEQENPPPPVVEENEVPEQENPPPPVVEENEVPEVPKEAEEEEAEEKEEEEEEEAEEKRPPSPVLPPQNVRQAIVRLERLNLPVVPPDPVVPAVDESSPEKTTTEESSSRNEREEGILDVSSCTILVEETPETSVNHEETTKPHVIIPETPDVSFDETLPFSANAVPLNASSPRKEDEEKDAGNEAKIPSKNADTLAEKDERGERERSHDEHVANILLGFQPRSPRFVHTADGVVWKKDLPLQKETPQQQPVPVGVFYPPTKPKGGIKPPQETPAVAGDDALPLPVEDNVPLDGSSPMEKDKENDPDNGTVSIPKCTILNEVTLVRRVRIVRPDPVIPVAGEPACKKAKLQESLRKDEREEKTLNESKASMANSPSNVSKSSKNSSGTEPKISCVIPLIEELEEAGLNTLAEELKIPENSHHNRTLPLHVGEFAESWPHVHVYLQKLEIIGGALRINEKTIHKVPTLENLLTSAATERIFNKLVLQWKARSPPKGRCGRRRAFQNFTRDFKKLYPTGDRDYFIDHGEPFPPPLIN